MIKSAEEGVPRKGKRKRKSSLPFWLVGAVSVVLVGFLLYAPSEPKPFIWAHRMPGASNRELDRCLHNLERLVLAIKLFTHEEKRRPTKLVEVTMNSDPILKSIPLCPAAGSDTYSQGYEIVNIEEPLEDSLHPTQAFIIACTGANHEAVGVPPNYPLFDLRVGFLSGNE